MHDFVAFQSSSVSSALLARDTQTHILRPTLHIAAKVRVADRLAVQYLGEAGGSATKLHIRPTGIAHAGLIEAAALVDEFGFGLTMFRSKQPECR